MDTSKKEAANAARDAARSMGDLVIVLWGQGLS
jgi:hypothetical protein